MPEHPVARCTAVIEEVNYDRETQEITMKVSLPMSEGPIPVGPVVLVPVKRWKLYTQTKLIEKYVEKIISGEIKE